VNGGALQDTLKTSRRFRVFAEQRDQIAEVVINVIRQIADQFFDINTTGAHDGQAVLIFRQGEQQMFQCRVFVAALPRH